MRRRYLTGVHRVEAQDDDNREWWEKEFDGKDCLAKTVYEPEERIRRTALLDAAGNPIYSVDEPEPIGFISHK